MDYALLQRRARLIKIDLFRCIIYTLTLVIFPFWFWFSLSKLHQFILNRPFVPVLMTPSYHFRTSSPNLRALLKI